MSRLENKFQELKNAGRKGLVIYITAGMPDAESTAGLVLEAEKAGADIIELGVPFSDPMADGPVIQAAARRAVPGCSVAGCQWIGFYRQVVGVYPWALSGGDVHGIR